MTTVNQMKCACPDCLCIVSLTDAVMHAGKPYCSEACANGHRDGSGNCAHNGCGCHA
jgi:metallothionein